MTPKIAAGGSVKAGAYEKTSNQYFQWYNKGSSHKIIRINSEQRMATWEMGTK